MHTARIREFFVAGQDRDTSHVLLHITEPTTPEEEAKGYFFAVVELNNAQSAEIEHMQRVIDDLESGYYETVAVSDNEKDAFEATLEYLNRRSGLILTAGSEVHCLVGVMKGNELAFSYHGAPHGVLFYTHNNQAKRMNIIGEPNEDNEQLFSSIMQGQVNPGDTFFIGTPHITTYFPYDRLEKILSKKSSADTATQIQHTLEGMKDDRSFGGLLLDVFTSTTAAKAVNTQTDTAAHSLNKLMHAAQNTRDTMSPPLFKQLRQKLSPQRQPKEKAAKGRKKKQHGRKPEAETNHRPRQKKEDNGNLTNTILITLGRALVALGVGIAGIIVGVLRGIIQGLLLLFILITNKNNGRREALTSIKRQWRSFKGYFIGLPLPSKLLLAVTIIAAGVFAGSLTYHSVNARIEAEQLAAKQHMQAIADKVEAAEASAIYNNDDKAFTLLKEAENMLASAPTDEQYREKIDALSSQIDQELQGLRNVTRIEPKTLATLTTLNENAAATQLALIDDTLVAFGPNDTTHYSYNIFSESTETYTHDNIPGLIRADTPKEENATFVLTESNSIGAYKPETNSITHQDITYPQENPALSDIFIYSTRLYTVDANTGQIYKHNPTQTGYDKGAAWITDGSTITSPRALAIDGDVYVLSDNGSISKYTRGSKQTFAVSGLDPAFDKPTDLWTYNGVDYLYILEPSRQRIVVLNKDGSLVRQYTADAWQKPSGFVVNPESESMYVLDENVIYEVGLQE